MEKIKELSNNIEEFARTFAVLKQVKGYLDTHDFKYLENLRKIVYPEDYIQNENKLTSVSENETGDTLRLF